MTQSHGPVARSVTVTVHNRVKEEATSNKEDREGVQDSPQHSNLARGALGGVARELGFNGSGGDGFGENQNRARKGRGRGEAWRRCVYQLNAGLVVVAVMAEAHRSALL
jgi:hypothetical protein